jgi:hypothetical protein
MFTSLLLLYPVVAMVFGASAMAGNIVRSTDPLGNETMSQLIAAGVVLVPLFAVPSLLKNSLNTIGNLGSKINSLGSRAQGSARARGKKAYENSTVGRGRALRKAAKENYKTKKVCRQGQ